MKRFRKILVGVDLSWADRFVSVLVARRKAARVRIAGRIWITVLFWESE